MFTKSIELCNYDVFPKVVLENTPVTITIKPLGWHAAFKAGKEYHVILFPRNQRNMPTETDSGIPFGIELFLVPDADGCLRITHSFQGEQPWFIQFMEDDGKRGMRLTIFSLHHDMAGRYPLIGDMHVHTRISDGREAPAIVAANLRKQGYDFTVITDHRRYHGSLEAIRAYEGVPIDLTIVPGEEIHLTACYPHIVNFGGLHSVNSQIDTCEALREVGDAPEMRSMDPANCPPIISEEQYKQEVREIMKGLGELPEGVDPFTYAACIWVFDRIRAGDGLAIFPHPYWIAGSQCHIPEALCDYMLKTQPFDAFELLGGEHYLDQNEFQVYRYMDARIKGADFPVVGSSDSHGSTPNNPDWNVAATIIFARANERRELIDSVRKKYSVAVDNISKEPRLAGDFRFVQYGRFLFDNYLPLHDELCYEEGRLMKDYITGNDDTAVEQLARLQGRVARLQKKYFRI